MMSSWFSTIVVPLLKILSLCQRLGFPDSPVGKKKKKKIHLQCRRLQFDLWVQKILWRRNRLPTPVFLGFPCGSAGKESTGNVGDLGSIPGLGRSPGKGKGYPLQYSGLENSMDCIVYWVTKSWSWLSHFPFVKGQLGFVTVGEGVNIWTSHIVFLDTAGRRHSTLPPPASGNNKPSSHLGLEHLYLA